MKCGKHNLISLKGYNLTKLNTCSSIRANIQIAVSCEKDQTLSDLELRTVFIILHSVDLLGVLGHLALVEATIVDLDIAILILNEVTLLEEVLDEGEGGLIIVIVLLLYSTLFLQLFQLGELVFDRLLS